MPGKTNPEEDMMTEETKAITADAQEGENKFYSVKKLMATSSQAVIFSWFFVVVIALLGINVIVFLLSLAGVQLQGAIFTAFQYISNFSTTLLLIGVAGFFFVFLRAIAEGLFLLMDLEEQVSNINERMEETK
jgi:hypothetical protein